MLRTGSLLLCVTAVAAVSLAAPVAPGIPVPPSSPNHGPFDSVRTPRADPPPLMGINDPSASPAEIAWGPGPVAAEGAAEGGLPDPNEPPGGPEGGGPFDPLCTCGGLYERGSFVTALIDAPSGNPQISAGDVGLVHAGRFFGGGDEDLMLVEWQIDNGHEGLGLADCPEDEMTPPGTGWYVRCFEVGPAEVGCSCVEQYEPGELVVATVDNPDGNVQILAGDIGVVVSARTFLGDEFVLVSWPIDNGHEGLDAAECPPDATAPEGTGWYVSCDQVQRYVGGPEAVCVCGDYQVGDRVVLTTSTTKNPDLEPGQMGTVVGGRLFGSGSGNDNLVLVAWDGLSSGHDGFDAVDCPPGAGLPISADYGWYVFCDQISPAEGGGCTCDGLQPGDEVIALIDAIEFNPQISAGDIGVVRCGRFQEGVGTPLVLVDWSGITNGHDGFGACDCPLDPGLSPDATTGWYVRCDTVARLDEASCNCDGAFEVGDRVVAVVDAPDGNQDIGIGDTGTVICSRVGDGSAPVTLVRWDALASGHDGLGNCQCGLDGLPDGSTDGWFVPCAAIVRASCSDVDFDDDGDVDFADVLLVLSSFGDCFGCPADIDASGDVAFGDLLAVLADFGPCP